MKDRIGCYSARKKTLGTNPDCGIWKVARPMIRVLFVMLDLGAGGAELSLLELLKRLDRSRVKPSLFLLHRNGMHLDQIGADMDVSFGYEGNARMRYHMLSILKKAVSLGSRADVIVGSMEGMPTYVAWLAAKLLRKPIIGWIRTELDEYLTLLPGWNRRIARWLYPRCDAVVVPSTGCLHSLSRVTHIPASRLRTIHNAVDRSRVRALAAERLPAIGNTGQRRYVLGIGRLLNAQKGFDLLVRAHAAVRSRGINHDLVILGEGKDRLALEKLAHSLYVQDSLSMPGFQRNPFPWLQNARALVAPARVDGLGRIFLEAIALGVPVIGSPASGPTEVLNYGDFGIVVKHEDVDSLADAIASILLDDELHARYVKLSLERSREYAPMKSVRQWEELLQGV
jgi:glycosyltransferase involved in cell wall biosynthesis